MNNDYVIIKTKSQQTFTSTTKSFTLRLGFDLDKREDISDILAFDIWKEPPRLEIDLIVTVSKSTTPEYELKTAALATMAER